MKKHLKCLLFCVHEVSGFSHLLLYLPLKLCMTLRQIVVYRARPFRRKYGLLLVSTLSFAGMLAPLAAQIGLDVPKR